MREIKFRVFDTKQMKFLEIHDFIDETWQFNGVAGFGNIGILAYQIRENGELNSKLIYDDERFKIEQFTGVKDKNKNEIYEGDIVKFAVFDLSFDVDENVEKFEKRYEKDEVVFANGRFIAGIKYGSNESLALMQELEVIGNIYEEELLNERD